MKMSKYKRTIENAIRQEVETPDPKLYKKIESRLEEKRTALVNEGFQKRSSKYGKRRIAACACCVAAVVFLGIYHVSSIFTDRTVVSVDNFYGGKPDDVNMDQLHVAGTLGDLVDTAREVDLQSWVTIVSVSLAGEEDTYINLDKRTVWNLLIAPNLQAKNREYDTSRLPDTLAADLLLNVDVWNMGTVTVHLTEDGYALADVQDETMCYDIGEDAVRNFVEYVKNNCDRL